VGWTLRENSEKTVPHQKGPSRKARKKKRREHQTFSSLSETLGRGNPNKADQRVAMGKKKKKKRGRVTPQKLGG